VLRRIRARGLDLDEPKATCLYRVLQETLTNVAKHANARTVHVGFHQRDGHAILEVRDDGRGFNVDAVSRRRGIGLIGMKERLHRCGGELEIQSSPGKGTRVIARVPMRPV
jgi:signal transduction histidine kinase